MCQICTIAARYSRHPLDRTQPETQVFHLNQFSQVLNCSTCYGKSWDSLKLSQLEWSSKTMPLTQLSEILAPNSTDVSALPHTMDRTYD